MRPLPVLGLLAMLAPAADPPAFTFPDPLKMPDGTTVTTQEQWRTKRVPELKELFQREMYGRYPDAKTAHTVKVLFEDAKAFGGKGTLREVELTLMEKVPPLRLLVAVPNERPKAGAPVFVGLNFSGNHTLVDDERARLPAGWMYDKQFGAKDNKATADGRGKASGVWPLADIVKAGYAVVTCYNGDIQEDRKDAPGPFMRAVALPSATGEPRTDDTATVMLWAWGVGRLVDYAVGEKEFDAKRVAVVGHSRLGKTALVAGAFDERVACVFPHQAGCGGTGPSRHADPKAESIKRINTAFPHWFSTKFKAYNDDPDKLPIDQHELLALCAPRPVFYSNAAEDQWANPTGQFDMLKRATPVYELFGVKGVEVDAMPKEGEVLSSRLGYWVRAGKHEMNADDWKQFLAFADKWMK